MKFVMVGSGAVGSYFAAKLQQSGQEVIFVARGQQLQALREHGLTIRSEHGDTRLPLVTATDDLASIGQADYVLISVKTWQLDPLLPQLTALQGANSGFLTLQNGVEAPHQVAQHVGVERTMGGLVRGFFQIEAPGVVRHVGVQPAIIFGQIDGQQTPLAETLLQTLTQASIYAELAADIEAALWEKFMFVTALSGVGTVTRSTVGEFRDYPPTRQMLENVMREIVTVGRARGVRLGDDVIERWMQFAATFPAEATTSMQRDIYNGLPSELEAQTGAVVRLGRAAGVTTPVNQFIYDSLILQELRARANYSR